MQTQSLSVGQVTSQELIVGLPLNGRSATQLLLLEGGAVLQSLAGAGRRVPRDGAHFRRRRHGHRHALPRGRRLQQQSRWRARETSIPFPDALQEFRTESGVRDARYGMSAAATVNAVTKSGTNEYHGNAFDFVRNHRFNSIAFFNKTENGGLGLDDGLSRHQFGGTLGGPVRKDKLFFFVGIQATINNVRPADNEQHRADGRGAPRRLPAHHVGGLPRHESHARGAVRGQPGQPGALSPALAEDPRDGARRRSRAGSGRLRTVSPGAAGQQQRPTGTCRGSTTR